MARTTYEDDEFEDIKSTFKPGDISDIFESDDDDYTIESTEDDYDDDDDEYDGDYRDFDILEETTTVNDIVNNENSEDKDDEPEKENDITPEFDSTEEVIEEMSDEEKWLNILLQKIGSNS